MRSMQRWAAWPLSCALLGVAPTAALAGKTDGDAGAQRGGVAVPKECREIEMNGPRLTGTALKLPGGKCTAFGVELDSASLGEGLALRDGRILHDVILDGTALRSASAGAIDASGALLLGTTVTGVKVRLRIDEAPGAGKGAAGYRVSYQRGRGKDPSEKGWAGEGGFASLCSGDERALPLVGRFAASKGRGGRASDLPTLITWACEGASLAKCALRLGYKPWERQQTARGAVSLATYHEACVRALRADYCGDGGSYTQPGTPVNIYDQIGVQRDDATWPVEADWNEGGALCVSQPRWSQLPPEPGVEGAAPRLVREALQRACPERLKPCPERPAPGALLRTEAAARP